MRGRPFETRLTRRVSAGDTRSGDRRRRGRSGRVAGLVLLIGSVTGTVALAAGAAAEEPPYRAGDRTRGLVGGWGHSWRPIFGKTRTPIAFVAFHPRMGWFVADRLELYGEATLFAYHHPGAAVAAGLGGFAGRYYLATTGRFRPYIHAGAGLVWTNLDVPEIDRLFNFQLFVGIGWRQARPRGPRWLVEFRNHHISNAGTAGRNLGINAATVLTGIEWVLRPSPSPADPPTGTRSRAAPSRRRPVP